MAPSIARIGLHLKGEGWVAYVTKAADDFGWWLVSREADMGHVVWSWSRAGEPGPVFLTERAALEWMAARLDDDRTRDA